MPIKLNRYILTDDTINQMKAVMHKSRQTGFESVFALCADQKDNLHARDICIGDAYHIDVEPKCNEDEKYTGSYHTHPRTLSLASASDLIKCGLRHNTCIAGQSDNKTRCYIWQHEPITAEKYDKFKDMINKGVMQIDDPLYKKNFECMKEFVQLTTAEHAILEGDKTIRKQHRELQMAKQEKTPKHTIKEMEKALKSNLEYRSKFASEMNKKIAQLSPKYYKEKILW